MHARNVYLDFAASTPIDARVLEAMLPHLKNSFGNPSSLHRWGQRADAVIESSRRVIAEILGCTPPEIIFTSCGSESDNLALRGAAFAARSGRAASRILTTPVEHPAVLRTAEQLATLHGFQLELLPVDEHGRLQPETLASQIGPDVALVSVIYANNEIGTINPISEIAHICRQHGIPFHTDAVQAASQLSLDVQQLNVDLMSLGAHKFYGPKGIGVLFVRAGIHLVPMLTGGAQEHGMRAGTSNTPSIAGCAEALRIAVEEHGIHNPVFVQLRDHLISSVLTEVPHARLTGHPAQRLPNHASFVFRDVDANQLLAALDLAGYSCSSGSACKSGDPEPSHVLEALGIAKAWSHGSLRVTIGRGTSFDDIDGFLEVLPQVITRLRKVRRVKT